MDDSRRQFLKTTALGSGGALCSLSGIVEQTPTEQKATAVKDRSGAEEQAEHLADLINVLQGTDSSPEFSRGNTLPIVAAPFGMGHWTLQTTSQRGPWFFHPE